MAAPSPVTVVTADSYQLYRTLTSMLSRAAIVRIACETGDTGIEVHDALYPHGYPVEATADPDLPVFVYVQRASLAEAVAGRHPAVLAVGPDGIVVNGVELAAMVDLSRIIGQETARDGSGAVLSPELQPVPEPQLLPVTVMDRSDPPPADE